MYFFRSLATRLEFISSWTNSLPFFQCCAVTTSPVSILLVQTNFGTIPSADNAVKKDLNYVLGRACGHLVLPYMLHQMHHLLSLMSILTDKNVPTYPPHFQLKKKKRLKNIVFKSHILILKIFVLFL